MHSHLRRDVGVCAGIAALVHTALGLQVHMGGAVARYFTVPEPGTPAGVAFVTSNYLGLASAAVMAVLVGLSNDAAIRSLGIRRWKGAQRLAYLAAAAAIAHGLTYQILEGRPTVVIVAVAATGVAVVLVRLGAARARRSLSEPGTTSASSTRS